MDGVAQSDESDEQSLDELAESVKLYLFIFIIVKLNYIY